MSEVIRISKLDAAHRQLNASIRMLFAQEDPVVVHTLVGAASIVFTDLVEHRAPDNSWDKIAQECNSLKPDEYFRIMRNAQNFMKHASLDPDGVLDFDPSDTEALIFWAVLNASELAPMSPEAEVFQLWYIASHSPIDDPKDEVLATAVRFMGDLRAASRADRLARGARVLEGWQPRAG